MSDTVFTGPIKAGNVLQSDGTGNLAGVGGSSGTANVGYAQLAQYEVVTQAASAGGGAGVYTSQIVIPAQTVSVRAIGQPRTMLAILAAARFTVAMMTQLKNRPR